MYKVGRRYKGSHENHNTHMLSVEEELDDRLVGSTRGHCHDEPCSHGLLQLLGWGDIAQTNLVLQPMMNVCMNGGTCNPTNYFVGLER